MKQILFLSHRIAWPPDKGEKIRSWNVLARLAQRYAVHFGCPADDPQDLPHIPEMQRVCASVGVFPIDRRVQKLRALLRARPGRPLMPDFYHAPALQHWVDMLLAKARIDAVYLYSVAAAPYVLNRPRDGGIRLLLDAIDIDSEKWAEYAQTARYPMKAIWAREGRTLLRYERYAAARADATFFVSEPEARRFIELAPECAARTDWVENGVDLERFSPAHAFLSPFAEPGPALVFTGTMDYWPNIDAVTWFAQDILPRIRETHAGAQFWIVGASPAAEVERLASSPGVHVTGRVLDTRPYIAHAAACVCPLRIARGIQNKVLEAMAMGRPVIASPAAFLGVRAKAGEDLLIAADPAGFAQSVMAILDGSYPQLGARARLAMENGYSWDATLARLDRYLP